MNDSTPSTNPYSEIPAGDIDGMHKPQFLYRDDASDIKSHPFFREIPWAMLHEVRPPMIPRVKHGGDTKYFDQEAPISEVDEMSSDSFESERHDEQLAIFRPASEHFGAREVTNPDAPGGVVEFVAPIGKSPKEKKKRAKDRILRDETTMKDAMELRKAGAFLGYMYRRPTDVILSA